MENKIASSNVMILFLTWKIFSFQGGFQIFQIFELILQDNKIYTRKNIAEYNFIFFINVMLLTALDADRATCNCSSVDHSICSCSGMNDTTYGRCLLPWNLWSRVEVAALTRLTSLCIKLVAERTVEDHGTSVKTLIIWLLIILMNTIWCQPIQVKSYAFWM